MDSSFARKVGFSKKTARVGCAFGILFSVGLQQVALVESCEAAVGPVWALPSERPIAQNDPDWVPAAQALSCMSCRARFTCFKRRHHCRVCGKVVCSKCSNKFEYSFLDVSGGTHRACQKCHAYASTNGLQWGKMVFGGETYYFQKQIGSGGFGSVSLYKSDSEPNPRTPRCQNR